MVVGLIQVFVTAAVKYGDESLRVFYHYSQHQFNARHNREKHFCGTTGIIEPNTCFIPFSHKSKIKANSRSSLKGTGTFTQSQFPFLLPLGR